MIAFTERYSPLSNRLTGSHVILRDWLAFNSAFLNIHRGGVHTALAWMVLHETAAVSAQVLCTPYHHAPCYFMQSHIRKVYACLAVTCHLHFWQNDRDLLLATVVIRGWNGGQHRSRPWRRKFSRRSCRDSNPRPFNHESGALTTDLSRSSSRVTIIYAEYNQQTREIKLAIKRRHT